MKKFLYTLTMAAALSGMQANAENVFSVSNASLSGKPGETVIVELELASDVEVAGFQANVAADKAGLSWGEVQAGTAALESVWKGSNAVTDQSYNVLFYSETCKTYTSNAKKVVAKIPVTIPSTATDGTVYNLTIGNGVISTAAGVAANCTGATLALAVKSAPLYKIGDVDGNNSVDLGDIKELKTIISEEIKSNTRADVFVDGAYDLKDLSELKKIISEQ